MSVALRHAIVNQFGSVGQLKSNFSAAALGMMTSGWIWLVMDQQMRLAVIPTYGAGTILVRSRQQRTPRSGLVVGEARKTSSSAYNPNLQQARPVSPPPVKAPKNSRPTPSARSYSTAPSTSSSFPEIVDTRSTTADARAPFDNSKSAPVPGGNLFHYGERLSPLLCVSVHEHAWMMDYGVWGKEEYLARFWNVVDWAAVSQTHDHFVQLG